MSLRFLSASSVVLGCAACGANERAGEDGKVDATSVDASVDANQPVFDEVVRAVSSSARTLCAVTSAGRLACWGRDEALGLLGDGVVSMHSLDRPTTVGSASDWSDVSSGPYMHCARNMARQTWCWGHAASPGFGDPSLTQSVYASPVKTPLAFAQLALGEYHACGLSDDGLLSCWGDNSYGQLGASVASSREPVRLDARLYQSVSVGRNHTCALDREGALWCFGRNLDRELGNAAPETSQAPIRMGTDRDWRELGCAATSCCARKQDASVWCWGDGMAPHAIAQGVQRMRVLPDATCMVATDGSVACHDANATESLAAPGPDLPEIAGGLGYRCLLSAGELACRGDNTDADGVLGRGVPGFEPSFVAVDSGWTTLALSSTGGCGITQDGALRCWGDAWGASPTDVTGDHDWSALANGCAIRAGRLFCWDAPGALGEVAVDAAKLVQVTGGDTVCARSDAQALYCWKRGEPAQRVDGLWQDVSATGVITAVREDGTLWRWSQGTAPVRLGLGTSYRHAFSSSSGDSCGLDQDGMAYCTLDDGVSLGLLTAARGAEQLFDMPDGVCLAHNDRSLACFLRGGHAHGGDRHGWEPADGYGGDATIPLPTAPIQTLVGGWDLRCLLRASGERACAGRRQNGSFGDGSDDSALRAVLPRI